MSEFHDKLQAIEKLRCTTCYGSGQCDDAEAGDIVYNKWTCNTCKGTGIKPSCVHQMVQVSSSADSELLQCTLCGHQERNKF
jgi:DnaJ-class molecular chaperone